jgi:hypothetical protein
VFTPSIAKWIEMKFILVKAVGQAILPLKKAGKKLGLFDRHALEFQSTFSTCLKEAGCTICQTNRKC